MVELHVKVRNVNGQPKQVWGNFVNRGSTHPQTVVVSGEAVGPYDGMGILCPQSGSRQASGLTDNNIDKNVARVRRTLVKLWSPIAEGGPGPVVAFSIPNGD